MSLTREPAMAGDMPGIEDMGRVESSLLPKLGSIEVPPPGASTEPQDSQDLSALCQETTISIGGPVLRQGVQDKHPPSSRLNFFVGTQQVSSPTPVASARVTVPALAMRHRDGGRQVGNRDGSCLRKSQEPRRASLMGPPGLARKETTATRVTLRLGTGVQSARARTSPTLPCNSKSPMRTACLASTAGAVIQLTNSTFDCRGASAVQEGVLFKRSPRTCTATAVTPWVLPKRG